MDGKSLRVNLIANTSQFKSAMTESSRQISLLNSEFKKAANETDQYGNKLDATSAKKKQLNGVIQQYQARVKAITNEQKHWTNELKKGNITETEHVQKQQELARRLNNTEAEMKRYEGQLKRINAEGKATARTYADFDKQFRQVGNTMRDVGAQVGITSGVGFVAMKRVLSDVVNEAKDFHAQMSEVKAISGATGTEIEKLTQQSKDLGKATKYTAEEAALSQANLARAGFNTNEIMGAMPGLLDLAASSNLELGTSADITANIIRTFGFEASKAGKVADVLAKGAATANIDVQGLGGSMKTAGPIAKSLGISFESVAAATGLMADAGLAGEEAGRMLRQGMLRLAKPTGEAAKIINKMGVEVFDADGNMKSLDKVVGELQKGMKGYTGQQKAAALATLFGSESTAGWTVLLDQGADVLADYTKQLESSEGAAKEMADVMQDNAQGSIVRMQSALSGLKIELGEKLLPTLAKGADFIGDLANKMSEWDEETISTIAQTALLATGVLGVTTVVSGLVAGLGAFMMVAGPVGLAIAGGTLLLGGLAAAIYTNQQKTENLRKEQEIAANEAIRYGEGLSEGTKQGIKGYVDLYEGAKVKMLELKSMSGQEASATSAQIVKAFSEMADAVIAELEVQKEKLSLAINEVYAVAGEAGVNAAQELSQKVLEAFDADIAEYKNALDVIKQVQQEFSGDVSKLPDDLRVAYQEALKVMGDGAREFAQTQEELSIIQQNIVDRQGGILFDEVQSYTKRINETYANSINSALDWSAEKTAIFEQGLAQGKISQDEFNSLMASTEATTAQMIAESVRAQEESLMALAENLDARGKLIDLATGEEFARLQQGQLNRHGIMLTQEESELEYYERWREHNKKFVEDTVNFSEAALIQQKETLIAALQELGMTREAAVAEAEKLMADTLAELGKGDDEARESGKKKGDAHKEGLESTKPENEQAGEQVAGSVLEYMEKFKDESGQAGKDKGEAHKAGLDSTKGANEQSAQSISDGANQNLNTNEDGANNAGKNKGDAHKTGLDSTKGANEKSSDALSLSVTENLGKTTDGDGGVKAGSMFNQGILSYQGKVNITGKNVAESGKKGLASVKTTQTGTDFVTGFSRAISAGSGVGGSVWTAAKNLGSMALRALKRSIDSHSPSEETKKEGKNFADGFGIAIDDGTKNVTKSAMQLGTSAVTNLATGISNKRQNALKEVTRLIKDIRAEVSGANEIEQAELKKNNEEIKKIEKRASEDVYLVRKKATQAKRKLTEAETIRIRRIEEDAAKKIQNLQKKNNKIEIDITKRQHTEMLKMSEDYVQQKKSNGEMTLVDEIYFWNAMYGAAEKGSDLYNMAMDKHQSAVKQMRSEMEKTNEDYARRINEIDKKLVEDTKRLNDEYNQAYQSRFNELQNFNGLLKGFVENEEVTGQELIRNLESQVMALGQFNAVIDDLGKRISNQDLVDELKALGPSALGELKALSDLSTKELDHYVKMYENRFKLAKDQAEKELKPMKDDVAKQIKEMNNKAQKEHDKVKKECQAQNNKIVNNTGKEFDSMRQVGIDAIKGLEDGMLSMESSLAGVVRRVSDTIKNTIRSDLEINSPSKYMNREVGKQVPAGVSVGIEKNIAMVKKSMNKMSEAFKLKVDDYKVDFGKVAYAVDNNKQAFKVEHEINNGGLENKISNLTDEMKSLTSLFKQMLQLQAQQPKGINPAPVLLDGREVGEIIFNTVSELQHSDISISALTRGVKL